MFSIISTAVLSFLKKYWREFAIIALVVLLYFKFEQIAAKNNKIERLLNNVESNIKTPNKVYNVVTKDEFKKFQSSLLDSIQAKIDKGIKAKDIVNVTEVHEHYIDSSKTYYNSKPIGNNGVFDISHVSSCFGFNGQFDAKDTSVTLFSKWYTNDIDIVVYKKRSRWFGSENKFVPNWFMPKKYYIDSYDKCNSQRMIKQTEIIKKD